MAASRRASEAPQRPFPSKAHEFGLVPEEGGQATPMPREADSSSSGTAEPSVQRSQRKPPVEAKATRLELLRRLNAIDRVASPTGAIVQPLGMPQAASAEAPRVTEVLRGVGRFIHAAQTLGRYGRAGLIAGPRRTTACSRRG
jgi:hypothetical protein